MPFISKTNLEKLERAARNDQDVKKLEKRFNKDLANARRSYGENLEDLQDEHAAEVRTLERAARKVNDAVKEATDALKADQKVVIANLTRDFEASNEAKDDEIDQLEGKVEVLETRVQTAAELTLRELNLADKEDEATRAAELVSNREKALEKKIKEFDARVKDENEAQYKSGYTDGVSDTLREANTLSETANERVFKLADKAISKDTTVITTTQTPAKQSK